MLGDVLLQREVSEGVCGNYAAMTDSVGCKSNTCFCEDGQEREQHTDDRREQRRTVTISAELCSFINFYTSTYYLKGFYDW